MLERSKYFKRLFVRHRKIMRSSVVVRHRQINAPVYLLDIGKLRLPYLLDAGKFIRITSWLEKSLSMPIYLMLRFTDIS